MSERKAIEELTALKPKRSTCSEWMDSIDDDYRETIHAALDASGVTPVWRVIAGPDLHADDRFPFSRVTLQEYNARRKGGVQ